MVKILSAVLTDGLAAVETACAEALAGGVHSADVILNILARRREPAPPMTILAPEALRLRQAPLSDCARYDRLRKASYKADTPPIEIAGGSVTVHRLRPIDEWLANRPVLISSATARPALVRRFFPMLKHVAAPPPAAPHQTVHQYLGGFGKHSISPRKLDNLRTLVQLEALTGKRCLVVCHLQHEHAFRGIAGVSVLHHGAAAGRNRFGDVDAQFTIGGTFLPREEIAKLASAEAGRLVPTEKPVRIAATALMADGSGVQFERLAYRDEMAQAIHESHYDDSVLQALGRARGLNRTAANPVTHCVFANAPLPLPVATLERGLPISRLHKLICERIVPVNAGDLFRFAPHLFPSEAAAAQAIYRWGGAQAVRAEVRRWARQLAEPWLAVAWQPKGQGHKLRTTLVAAGWLAALRDLVGDWFPAGLVRWHVAPFTAGRQALSKGDEDNDTLGKSEIFRDLSWSSPPSATDWGGAPPAAAESPPRAPPDG